MEEGLVERMNVMSEFKLTEASVKNLAIRVNDLDEMLSFYHDILGFQIKGEENGLAFLGTVELKNEQLILEEIVGEPRPLDETKVVRSFSLRVPSARELTNIFAALKRMDYPIEAVWDSGDRWELVVTDPEANMLEIYCDRPAAAKPPVSLDFDKLSMLSNENQEYVGLSAGSRIEKIHLNVQNYADSWHFYRSILGLIVADESNGTLTLDRGDFLVGLREAKLSTTARDPDQQIGVEFLTIELPSTAILKRLKLHLEQQQVDFFADRKLKILTVFDPNGLEWWFTRPKEEA